MFNITLVSHGDFAKELLETSKMIVGEQEGIMALGLYPGQNLEEFELLVENAIDRNKEKSKELIVLTDLMFGTPFNVVTKLMEDYEFVHITGINLPLYLEIATSRSSRTLSDLCSDLVEIGRSTIIDVNKMIEEEV